MGEPLRNQLAINAALTAWEELQNLRRSYRDVNENAVAVGEAAANSLRWAKDTISSFARSERAQRISNLLSRAYARENQWQHRQFSGEGSNPLAIPSSDRASTSRLNRRSSSSSRSSSSTSDPSSSSSSSSSEPSSENIDDPNVVAPVYQKGRYRRRYRRRRRSYRRGRKGGSRTVAMRIKCVYAFNITIDGTNAARIQYAVPVDSPNFNYSVRDNVTTSQVSNAPTYLEPFTKLKSLFDWYRTTGIKLEYYPKTTDAIGSTDQRFAMYPSWVGLDKSDVCNAPTFITENANLATFYEEALAQRAYATKMPSDQRWSKYFKIANVQSNMVVNSSAAGGNMGSWYSAQFGTANAKQYGNIYLEQPVIDSSSLAVGVTCGRLFVTKYMTFKGIAQQAGVPVSSN